MDRSIRKYRSITAHQKNLQSHMTDIYKTTKKLICHIFGDFLQKKICLTISLPKYYAGCHKYKEIDMGYTLSRLEVASYGILERMK